MAFSKSVNLTHAQTAVPCNVCEDETPGEYYCIECKQTLCPQCEKNHKRVVATKNHNIVLRTQVDYIDTVTFTCTDHGDNASFHCEKCDMSVCAKCVTGTHKGHALSDLADIFEREKRVIQNDVTKMRELSSKLEKEREEMILDMKKFKSKMKKITSYMQAENVAAHKELDRIHCDRMKDIASFLTYQSTVFGSYNIDITNAIDILEERIIEYEDVIGKNSLPAVINLFKINEPLPYVGKKPEIPKLPDFAPGDLQDLMKIVEKLNFSESAIRNLRGKSQLEISTPTIVSRFKCPLDGSPRICITKEGNAWLCGYESRELVMVDFKGQVLRRRMIQNRPEVLAVMDYGDIIISPRRDDSRVVSRLMKKNDREKQVFDTSPSWSIGVSVTADQRILICTGDGRVVKSNIDGSYVKQIYKGSGNYSAIHAVENADRRIYISDTANHAVVMISRDGNVLLK